MALRQQRTALKIYELSSKYVSLHHFGHCPQKLMAHGVRTHNRSKTAQVTMNSKIKATTIVQTLILSPLRWCFFPW